MKERVSRVVHCLRTASLPRIKGFSLGISAAALTQ